MRTRHQDGWIELTPAKTWKAHWHEYVIDAVTGKETRRHRSRVVGKKATMVKYEAKEELEKIVAGVNVRGSSTDGSVTLGWFYDNRFKPMREGGWGPATIKNNKTDMEHYIRPYLGNIPLKDIDLFKCQIHVNALAKKDFSEGLVTRAKTMVWSILEMARKSKFIRENPSEDVKMPVCKPTAKPTLSKEDIVRLFAAVTNVRDHLILEIGVFCATNASELFGLKWDCVEDDYLTIRNTAYCGEVYGWRVKRKTRFRQVPIPTRIHKQIEQWRKLSVDTEADSLIFPGENGAMWAGIFLQKRIQPIAEALGITVPVTFQVMRRSCATRNQKHGSMKDIQQHLGHSNIETTGNVYMQNIPESVKQMVDADYADVMATKVKKQKKNAPIGPSAVTARTQ